MKHEREGVVLYTKLRAQALLLFVQVQQVSP